MTAEKKTILHFVNDFTVGGVSIAITKSFEEINTSFNYYIVVWKKGDVIFFADFFETHSSKIFVLNQSTSRKQFFRFVKNNKVDIVISSLWRSHLTAYLFRFLYKKNKWGAFAHSSKFVHNLDRITHKLAIRSADVIIADSIATSQSVRTLTLHPNISVVPFIFAPNFSLRKHKNKINKPSRFVYISRIAKSKNPILAVELIARLKEGNHSVCLDLYGSDEGGMLSRTLDKAKTLGIEKNVTYKGTIPPHRVYPILAKYDFYILLSDYEGMAMSVVEAMQMGVVPLVTPVGEIANYAKHMQNAIVLQDGNMESFVNEIITVLNDSTKYQSMSDNAIQTFENKETYVDGLIKIVDAIR